MSQFQVDRRVYILFILISEEGSDVHRVKARPKGITQDKYSASHKRNAKGHGVFYYYYYSYVHTLFGSFLPRPPPPPPEMPHYRRMD
jgi:hypothetical protein